MYSQLPADCDDSHRAGGVRSFKAGVALGAGAGLLVGAIVALSFLAPTLLHTSAAESNNLAALPSSRSSVRGSTRVMSTNPDAPIKLGINGFGRIGRQVARIPMD